MEQIKQARTPTLLIVGAASLVWNAFGAFDYLMTQTGNEAYLSSFTEQQRAWFDSFPTWVEACWALGVWGAVVGSMLLLLRSRHAVAAFAVSIFGLAGTTVYQFLLGRPPEDMMTSAMIGFSIAIWAVAILLLLYARGAHERHLLR